MGVTGRLAREATGLLAKHPEPGRGEEGAPAGPGGGGGGSVAPRHPALGLQKRKTTRFSGSKGPDPWHFATSGHQLREDGPRPWKRV